VHPADGDPPSAEGEARADPLHRSGADLVRRAPFERLDPAKADEGQGRDGGPCQQEHFADAAGEERRAAAEQRAAGQEQPEITSLGLGRRH